MDTIGKVDSSKVDKWALCDRGSIGLAEPPKGDRDDSLIEETNESTACIKHKLQFYSGPSEVNLSVNEHATLKYIERDTMFVKVVDNEFAVFYFWKYTNHKRKGNKGNAEMVCKIQNIPPNVYMTGNAPLRTVWRMTLL